MEGLSIFFPRLDSLAKARKKARQRAERQFPVTTGQLLGLVVVTPVYLAISIPLITTGIVHRFFFFQAVQNPTNVVSTDEVQRITKEEMAKGFPYKRPYDIVILGATGFTGSLLAMNLTTYHPTLKIAIAGRTLSKVEAVKTELGVDSVGVFVADSSDLASLFELCRQA